MKQQILEILDKSTNNGMKADEIMRLLEQRQNIQDILIKLSELMQEYQNGE